MPEACKYLLRVLKSKLIPLESISPALQRALHEHMTSTGLELSSYVLELLAELQATKAPPVLGRELLLAVIALQDGSQQGKALLPTQPFTAYFSLNWQEMPLMLLKLFARLIDRTAGPPVSE